MNVIIGIGLTLIILIQAMMFREQMVLNAHLNAVAGTVQDDRYRLDVITDKVK